MTFFIPISNYKTLNGIRVRKQNRSFNRITIPREIIGIDVETDNGTIFLIADSQGNYLDQNISFEAIAKFLFRHDGKWIFFYNLGYDAGCILKLLPKEILQTYKQTKELRFEYGGFRIHYIERRKLTISKNHHSINCYDIAQYYDTAKLVDAYSKNIDEPDSQYLQMKQKRDFFSKFYYFRHKNQVRDYCIQDCIYTKELAEHWLRTFHSVFGFYSANWISAGYLAEKVLINNGITIPLFNETDYAVQEIARKSFYGGRFELIQRGFIGDCYLYDINSAYPYALTTLPDFTCGKWTRTNRILNNSVIGFFYIHANVSNKVKIAPFPFRKKNGTICYPCGQFRTFVTLDELRAITDPLVQYKILESYQFIPNENSNYPFKNFIESMYQKRLELKQNNDPLQQPIKIILNSIYGKTAQRTNRVMGNIFNPVVAAYTTGFVRAQLYSFVKKHNLENESVAFATDSIACRKKIGGLDSSELGRMKLDKSGSDVIFLSNGFYRFNGAWKKRGIGFDHEKNQEIEHINSRIDKSGQFYILVKTTKTIHIKSGILYNKLDKVGQIKPYEKKINLNSDKKRFWFSELKSLNDGSWCNSSPIPIDLVGNIISKEDNDWFEDEKYEPESDL